MLPLACWKDFVPARVPFICVAQETNTISPALLNKEIILEPLQLDVGNKLNKFHISSVVIAYLGHELADSMAAWLPTRGFFLQFRFKIILTNLQFSTREEEISTQSLSAS